MNLTRTAVLIDVRERKEFQDGTIKGAINLPLSKFHIEQYEGYRDNAICLFCQSGDRAKQVKELLNSNGFEFVILLDRHIERILENKEATGWSIDRQFRFILGLMIGLSLLAYFTGVVALLYFTCFISIMLMYTALIDRCYLRMGIAMLPWNRKKL